MHDYDRTQIGIAPQTGNYFHNGGGGMGEDEQMNLAAELMGVTNEQEFEYFLGDLFKKVSGAIGKVIHGPVGQALGGVLKDAAKQILPQAGQALGGLVGAPQIGQQLGSALGGMFETSSEEQEWEAANTFVKVATDAVKTAAQAPPGANPQAIANNAVLQAAQLHAPQLAQSLSGGLNAFNTAVPAGASLGSAMGGLSPHGHGEGAAKGRTGRWIRHGKHIVILGV